jgi:hypothetical protein
MSQRAGALVAVALAGRHVQLAARGSGVQFGLVADVSSRYESDRSETALTGHLSLRQYVLKYCLNWCQLIS